MNLFNDDLTADLSIANISHPAFLSPTAWALNIFGTYSQGSLMLTLGYILSPLRG